jgi:serine protease Do
MSIRCWSAVVSMVMVFVSASLADLQNQTDESCPHINDSLLYRSFHDGLTELFEDGKTASLATLKRELARDHVRLELPRTVTEEMSLPKLYDQCQRGVLIVGCLYMCEKCGKRHVGPATGFVLTSSGAIATAYHVVDKTESEALGAMTPDGKVYAVKEVIAASKIDDVAVLQLDGADFHALPLTANAPVGTSVAMIGHPSRQFYMLTTGIISRYYTRTNTGIDTLWMSATAEIGGGASGGPLLNMAGAVVGMASKTQSIYAGAHGSERRGVQMVIRQYVPASVILELLRSDQARGDSYQESPRQFMTRMAALEQSGSWDTYENEAKAWVADHPDELSTSMGLAGRLMRNPDRERRRVAEIILRQVLVNHPNSMDGLQMLAVLLQTRGCHLEAIEFYQRLLAQQPKDVKALNNLAWALSKEMGQHEQALVLVEEALVLAPEYADLVDTHGVICFRLKKYEAAIDSLTKSVRLYPPDARAGVGSRYYLVKALEAVGRADEARTCLDQCLNLHERIRGLTPEQERDSRVLQTKLSGSTD